MTDATTLLRHMLATLAYRAAKPLRDVPPHFASFRPAGSPRSAAEILAHLGDLLEWAASAAEGRPAWQPVPAGDWTADAARFYAALARLDACLAAASEPPVPLDRLWQGPIADAFTHVGQLSLLRRQAGAPVRGENFFMADIRVGRVTADQPPPVREFD